MELLILLRIYRSGEPLRHPKAGTKSSFSAAG
jgi:hypothetical protein